jgi:hypothetical protein
LGNDADPGSVGTAASDFHDNAGRPELLYAATRSSELTNFDPLGAFSANQAQIIQGNNI